MGGGAIRADTDERPIRFTDVLRERAFAVLYAAETQSTIGDQLARVALSVLVFERTGSAAGTALTYAATFLPAVLGGYLLAGVGDRFSRRAVMVWCDLARAALFALMAAPGLPLAAVVALLVVAVFIGPAFSASEVSLLAGVLGRERFRAATGMRMATGQLAQVAGFAVGGVLVAWLRPRGALVVDAVTYAISAVVILAFLRRGEAPAPRPEPPPAEKVQEAAPFPGLWRDPRLRALVALSALAGFFVVPEGLAVPFSAAIGAGTEQTGMLLAAIPLGGAVGAALLVRVLPRGRRSPAAGLMAVGCGIPLLVSATEPPWGVAWATWFASGVLAAYQVETITVLVQAVPDARRARSMGVVSACLVGAQGVGLALFGALARPVGVAHTIAVAGLVGSCIALVLVVGPLRGRWAAPGAERTGRHRTGVTTRSGS